MTDCLFCMVLGGALVILGIHAMRWFMLYTLW